MTISSTDVLIIGAGPTGLSLALWLTKLGVACRIVDKASAPGQTSRALAVQSRTLEFHRQIGIVDEVIAAGVKVEQLSVRTPRKVAAALKLSAFGEGISRYAYAFVLPQDQHERILNHRLEEAGVRVDRGVELASFEETVDGVIATLRKGDTTETVLAHYLCGCDGAHSAVRHGLGLDFPGGVYAQSFYVADVQGTGDVTPNGMDACLGSYGFALVLPVKQTGSLRLIGVVPKAHEGEENITFESIRDTIERDTGVTISAVNWFSTYRVHHRVAEKFRVGRVFIAGDAGHIHSPAGGQGMNTGIGDAVNLAWKLAAVIQARADAKLLDSYEPERIAFARLLIQSTDRAFSLVSGRSALAGFWRRNIMPRVAHFIMSNKSGARMFFKLISQTRINYRDSALSHGVVNEVRGGDRLPYVGDETSDNFAPLSSLDWQVHVYGETAAAFRMALSPTGIPVHTFAWTLAAKDAGLARDAAYLVRPDGHIAMAGSQDAGPFARFLYDLAVKPRRGRPAPARREMALAS